MLRRLNRAHRTDRVLSRSPGVSSSPSPMFPLPSHRGSRGPSALPVSLLSRAEARESRRVGACLVEVCGRKRVVTQGTSSS